MTTKTATGSDFARLFAAAATGAVVQANIVPVNGPVATNVRVTYNWLYSSLNCDPGDSSSFPWTIVKLDDTHVALSPVLTYEGMTLYASVRPDLGYVVEVQAPYSADWITAIGGDEIITMNIHDLNIVSFQGLNGAYITLLSSPDQHDDHTGYRMTSTGSNEQAALFLLRPTMSLQAGLDFEVS